MNYTKAWCLAGLLSLASVTSAQAQQLRNSPERTVAALEDRWLQSYRTNDPDLIAPMLADKFTSTGADGKLMDKAEALAAATDTWVKMPDGRWQCMASQDTPIQM